VDGGVIGVGITFCIFTISTNHDKLKKKNYTGHSKSNIISAQIFKCCTEFTRNNTLPLLRHFALEADNFSSYFDYFQDEEKILILSTTLFALAVYFTTTLSSHGTSPLINVLRIKLSFRTRKFLGYFLLNMKPQSDSQN